MGDRSSFLIFQWSMSWRTRSMSALAYHFIYGAETKFGHHLAQVVARRKVKKFTT